METIHKYVIDPNNPEIEMQVQAEILTVAFQGQDLCLWARVDADKELRTRTFYAFGTGQEIPRQMDAELEFVGTGFMDGGLVFHLLERLGA